MAFEEKLKDGILVYRDSQNEDWKEYTLEELSLLVVGLRESVSRLRRDREAAYLRGKQYEKDRLKSILGI